MFDAPYQWVKNQIVRLFYTKRVPEIEHLMPHYILT